MCRMMRVTFSITSLRNQGISGFQQPPSKWTRSIRKNLIFRLLYLLEALKYAYSTKLCSNLTVYVMDKDQDIRNHVASTRDYEKRVYKTPSETFISLDHNLIQEKEHQVSVDEIELTPGSHFGCLLLSYISPMVIDGQTFQSIDHYLAYKLMPD